VLLHNPVFNDAYQFVELNPVFLLTPEDAPHLAKLVSRADVFIHQPVSEEYKGKEISTDYLKSLVKKNSQVISIPVSCFTGYSPELFYLKDQQGSVMTEPFPYHDQNILLLYSQGKTVKETIQSIQTESFYTADYCRDNLEQTLSNLAIREHEQALDVQLSGFIREHFERYRLFHTFDHPSVAIVMFIAYSILRLLGVRSQQANINSFFNQSEMLDDYAFPIYPALSKHLKLQFESSLKYRCAFNMLEPESVVEQFFQFYDEREDVIKINLLDNQL